MHKEPRGEAAHPEYQITEQWLRNVRSALGKEWGAQARLARQIGCSAGTLTELLQGGKRSHLVPQISAALGVPNPTMILTPEAQEIAAFVEQMGPAGPGSHAPPASTRSGPARHDARSPRQLGEEEEAVGALVRSGGGAMSMDDFDPSAEADAFGDTVVDPKDLPIDFVEHVDHVEQVGHGEHVDHDHSDNHVDLIWWLT